jgi:hypothetical protein
MDELNEFCARMLGDRDAGAEVANAAREAAGDDLVDQLGFAIRACRERLGGGAVLDRAAPGTDGGLSAAVARELAVASARLPQRQREALALRELLRLGHEQIGDVIGIDTAAVAPLLARSRLRLRAELRGAPVAANDCPERERMLRTATLRQDGEAVPAADDDWFIEHLGHCAGCGRAHAAMLEGSVCYRGWRLAPAPPAPPASPASPAAT